MKKISAILLTAAASTMLVTSGCDWSSGGGADSFNTEGITVNFSGVYNGLLSGGRAVASTSGGAVTRLVINQAGNVVQITDNNGSTYEGRIGSPHAVASPDGGSYPAGATLAQGQINFSGHDNAANRDVQFTGIIHVVAVSDIRSETSTSSEDYERSVERSSVDNLDGTTTITETLTIGTPSDPFYSVETTVTVIETGTGNVISETTSSTGSTTTDNTFSLTEANSQYRLEGTWMEVGGAHSAVDALSPGSGGTITTSN